jgi:hypothetical protein
VVPVLRRGEHRVDVPEEHEHRSVGVMARQCRDQVGAIRRGREQLGLEPRLADVGLEVLDRRALVAGRVDRVETDQAL